MDIYLFFCLLLTTYIKDAMSEEETVEVQSPLGRILGSTMETRRGRKIFAFRGMRYADAPVGELRFKPPQPVKAWDGVLNATEEGTACPQPEIRLPSEDCLRLNVYSTELPTKDHNPSRPVIVYFHAGGFVVFSGQSYITGPRYLLDQDVVLVTANYRLGSLGFISMGDELLPGNLGLKDQVAVLRWVRDNIASFGGDPNSVTIVGCSAGGWSISLHVVSPMSRGLFHRAVVIGGSAVSHTPLPNHQKHFARQQAEVLGCNQTETTQEIIDCMKNFTGIDIGESMNKFEMGYTPTQIWIPVVEPDLPGLERFLPAQPVDLIRRGEFNHVPVMVGVTEDECAGYVIQAVEEARKGNNSIFDDLNQNWTRLAPRSFEFSEDLPNAAEIVNDLKRFYLHGQPASKDNYIDFGKIYADAIVLFSGHRFVNLMAQYSRRPVYYYQFSYHGRYSLYTWSDKTPYGADHYDDILYLFDYPGYVPFFNLTDPETKTVDRMTSLLTSFAKIGRPITSENRRLCHSDWSVFTRENQAYLDLGENVAMKARLNEARMREWERHFPLPHIQRRKKFNKT